MSTDAPQPDQRSGKACVPCGCLSVIAFLVVAYFLGSAAMKRAAKELAAADAQWDAGEQAEAIAKYKELMDDWRLIDKARRPVVLKRIIEFDLEAGDREDAEKFIRFALDHDVEPGLEGDEATALWDEIQEELQTAVPEIEYPKVVEQSKSPYKNVGEPFWELTTVFRETSGNCSYKVEGHGHIRDANGKVWVTQGLSSITRDELHVPAGGRASDHYWCSSPDHGFCNGRAVFTWSGKDEGGHPVHFEVSVLLKHTDCQKFVPRD